MELKIPSKLAIKGGVRALVLNAGAYRPSPAQPPQLVIAPTQLTLYSRRSAGQGEERGRVGPRLDQRSIEMEQSQAS